MVPMVIGRSVEGREIICYQVGDGSLHVLIAAGTHGNEVGTVKLAYRLLAWLTAQDIRFSRLTIYIIPCLNPDGFAVAKRHPDYFNFGRIGRFNANGVDLNRNFPTRSWQSQATWSHGDNYTEKTTVFSGQEPGSEPEIQALLAFMKEKKIAVYWAFHSAGRDVMGNENDRSQKLAKMFARASGYRFVTNKEWEAGKYTGSAKEWCDENNVAYIEVEATTRWGSDWKNQKRAIEATFTAMDGLLAERHN